MGGKHRAWACAGYGWMVDHTIREPVLMLADGERPVLCLPAGLTASQSEQVFAWGIADLLEQQGGWLALLRHTSDLFDLAVVDDHE
mgnify:CR=1 FL=1